MFILPDNRLFESANSLRGENFQLTIAIEKLKCETTGGSGISGANAALEARLLAQAEELTMMHRRRGEHAQQIVDLNNKMQELIKDLQSKEVRYDLHDNPMLIICIFFYSQYYVQI